MTKDSVIRISTLLSRIHPGFIFLALVLVFFGKKLIPLDGEFIGGMDVLNYHVWHLSFFKDQVLSGSIPLWNPYTFCGHPFWANPGNFILYPPIILYVILPLPWAFNIDQVLHFYVAGMGAFYLVRMITGSNGAGLVSAVIYSFSGHIIEGMYAGHLTKIHAAALLPWVFFFVEKVFRSGRFIHFALAGVVLGLQILTGNTQDNLYTAYFLGFYFLMRYVVEFGKQNLKLFVRYSTGFILVPVISFGLAAAWLIPAWEFISLSDRAKDTYDFATFMSFAPGNLFTLLVPQPETQQINTNWELGCYLGVLSLVLALIGLFFSKKRSMAIGLMILVLISLTFMLGGNTPMYAVYYKVLPLIGKVRVPGRALIIFAFLVSILAGMGAQHLIEKPERKKLFTFLIGALIVFIIAMFAGVQLYQVPSISKGMLAAVVLAGISFSLLFASPFIRSRGLLVSLIIAVLFLDLLYIYSQKIPTLNYNAIMAVRDYEEVFAQDKGFYRVMIPIGPTGGVSDMGCRGNVFHYENVSGDTPMVIKDFYQFVHYIAGVAVPEYVRHTLSFDMFLPENAFTSKILGIKYAIIRFPEGIRMMRADWVMPRAQLIRNARVVPDYQDHLAMVHDPDFNPSKTILLENLPDGHLQGEPSNSRASDENDAVKITSYTPNRIELSASAGASCYLLLSELFYPGWKAYVDEKPVPILRADYLLRAVPLAPGNHTVIVEYRPISLMVGAVISAITVGAFLVFLFWNRKRCSMDTAP